jgi:hypothetical protein
MNNGAGGLVARQVGMRCAYQILLEMIYGNRAVQRYEYINKTCVQNNFLV